jgi:ActR/RegA family two-component response regulator
MKDLLGWLSTNKEWFFSGLGVVLIAPIIGMLLKKNNKPVNQLTQKQVVNIENNVSSYQVKTVKSKENSFQDSKETNVSLDELKSKTHILFVDDDTRFKVVNILKKAGWIYTTRTADINSLDDSQTSSNQIFFIDVQGVGLKLGFKDEGLGLAKALKEKFPEKQVVIYSAETQGERFHAALRKADDSLSKNADPYEFQQLAESLAQKYWDQKQC